MIVLGHDHGDWKEDTLVVHESVLEQYVKRRVGELGVSETVTPYVLAELRKKQAQLDEAKALATAKLGGKGSGKKQRDIKAKQGGTRFLSSQRQHARTASRKLDAEVSRLAKFLQKQVSLFQSEKITFKRLEARTSIAFKSTVEDIFKLGMKAVGLVKPAGGSYDLTPNEQKWIKSYLDEELGYFKKFLKQIRSNPGRGDVRRRTELYSSALRSVYEAGRVLSVGPNVIITWNLESKNPCPDCRLIHKHNPYTPDTLPCLGGDTFIETLSGPYTIRDLAEGKYPYADIWVWSYDRDHKRITPGYVYDVRCVGESSTVQVFLDNGECIFCTDDHPWLLREGSYRNAGDLEEGTSLEPLYRMIEDDYYLIMNADTGYYRNSEFRASRIADIRQYNESKGRNHKVLAVIQGPTIPVYDMSVFEYENFGLSAGVFTHNTTPKAGQTRCRSNCYCTLKIQTAIPAKVKQVRDKHRNPNWLLKKIKDQQKKKV